MKLLGIGVGLALALSGTAAAASDLDGRWVTQTGNVEIVFAPCGSALCGSVTRVMANNSMTGSGTSAAPPPEIGQQIVTGVVPAGPDQWKGKLFDRESGKTYDCLLKPAGATMTLRAYILLPLFGKTLTWTRTDS
jgi:uncharacterized protein (DUF2147 family)